MAMTYSGRSGAGLWRGGGRWREGGSEETSAAAEEERSAAPRRAGAHVGRSRIRCCRRRRRCRLPYLLDTRGSEGETSG